MGAKQLRAVRMKVLAVVACAAAVGIAIGGCTEWGLVGEQDLLGHVAVPERAGAEKVVRFDSGALHPMSIGDATFEDLTILSPEELAQRLIGEGVTIVPGSASYAGSPQAAGVFAFTGDHDVMGISSGVILSSGRIIDVVGPNTSPGITTAFDLPGDPDLTALAGFETNDAAILEFQFTVPEGADMVYFEYVFGSEEYNEYVYSMFNDVFGFWLNGVNYALVEGDPVSVNAINNGNFLYPTGSPYYPDTSPRNPCLYVNNDPTNADINGYLVPEAELRYTEMDGFTVVLVFEAPVEPGVNTLRLAIADASDHILDSAVFIKEGSLSITPPAAKCVNLIAGQHILAGTVCIENDDTNAYVTYTASDGWILEETHLALSADVPGEGEWITEHWQNRSGNPAPGRFPYSHLHNPSTSEFTYIVPLGDISGGVCAEDTLFVAAHAVVREETQGTETAWGEGTRLVPKGNWAMYFDYVVR